MSEAAVSDATDLHLATARHNLAQAHAWQPTCPADERAKANTITQIEAWIAEHEAAARSLHPSGRGA